MTDPIRIHRFVAGTSQDGMPLDLFARSGGGERDLLPLHVGPGPSVIAIRGLVGIDARLAFCRCFPDRSMRQTCQRARRVTHPGKPWMPMAVGLAVGAADAQADSVCCRLRASKIFNTEVAEK